MAAVSAGPLFTVQPVAQSDSQPRAQSKSRPTSRPLPDAGPLYVQAVDALRAEFGVDEDGFIEFPLAPYVEDQPTVPSDPTGTPWKQLVEQSFLPLEIYAQAARLPDCTFPSAAADAEQLRGVTALDFRLVELGKLADLTSVRMRQHAAREEWRLAARDFETLLRVACHQMVQTPALFTSTGAALESLARSALVACSLPDEVLRDGVFAAVLDDHLHSRPSIREALSPTRNESELYLSRYLDEFRKRHAARLQSERTKLAVEAIRAGARSILDLALAPIEESDTLDPETFAQRLRDARRALRDEMEGFRARGTSLLDLDKILKADAGRPFFEAGKAVGLLIVPDTAGAVEALQTSRQSLEALLEKMR